MFPMPPVLRRCWIALWLPLAAVLPGGCERPAGSSDATDRPLVVCTTTMIADLARQIGGDDVIVASIMKPGQDPHIYEPRPDDSILFSRARLVLINGLHLEGKMLDMIGQASDKVVALAEDPQIPRRPSATAQSAPDPHVWWNARHFQVFARRAAEALARIDPVHKDAYAARAEAYCDRLEALHERVLAAVRTIPEKARYMITSHDAFYYYGEAYGLEVDAVLGISTDASANALEPARLARIAAERKIPAIFHETSVSHAQNELVDSIRRLAREQYGHDVRIAGPLYSDSLDEPGTPAGTYLGAIEANTRMIVEALGGKME
jgi:manganese/zinc/iron transport system substrate-binding protein